MSRHFAFGPPPASITRQPRLNHALRTKLDPGIDHRAEIEQGAIIKTGIQDYVGDNWYLCGDALASIRDAPSDQRQAKAGFGGTARARSFSAETSAAPNLVCPVWLVASEIPCWRVDWRSRSGPALLPCCDDLFFRGSSSHQPSALISLSL